MKPEEVSRVAKKILPWLPKNHREWYVALSTLIDHYDAALAEVQLQRALEQQGKFRRFLDQLEEPA